MSDEVEPVVVILLTKDRTEYMLRTVESARRNLRYPNLCWYIADGGSSDAHYDAAKVALDGERIIGWHRDPPTSYGRDANIAWQAAQKIGRLTLFLEDDWVLNRELDIRPYADLLMDNDQIAMVRMGYLNLGMVGKTIGYRGKLYWLLARDSDEAYVFTGHPSLRHWRFRESYGEYQEGLRPGETELSMAWQFRTKTGPGIVYPCENAEYGPFGHIGQVQSYT